MRLVGIVAALAAIWAAATGTLTLPNLLLGAVVAGLAMLLLRDRYRFPALRRLGRIAALAGLFLYELAASAVRVAILVFSPRTKLAPAIVAIPLRLTSDFEIVLLANLITLTPGTLTVDVSDDRRFLYVHAIDCRDREALIRSITSGFEQRIIEAFR